MNSTVTVKNDMVDHPSHYTSHPSGVEVYLVTQEMWCPNLANSWKYLARHDLKGEPSEDIRKALKYVQFEIARRSESWFWLPPVSELQYEARYAPFYKYIDSEPDELIKKYLIAIWNADKSEHPRQLHEMVMIGKFLEEYANELDRRAEAEKLEAYRESDQERELTVGRLRGGSVGALDGKMVAGHLPPWNEWEISIYGGWRKIDDYTGSSDRMQFFFKNNAPIVRKNDTHVSLRYAGKENK